MKVRVSHLSLESIIYLLWSPLWRTQHCVRLFLCSPRAPTKSHPHHTRSVSSSPPHYYYPRANSHFWIRVASRRAASLSLTHACCVSSLAPGHNNSPGIKTNLLLSHLFLFFSFFLPRYYRLSKLPWPSLSAVLFCSHVHCQFPHFFPLLLYINFSTWKKWLEEWRHREEAYADILRFLLFLF